MLRLPSARASYLLAFVLLFPGSALAQGPLTNGGNHPGSISAPGEIDEWTVGVTTGDAIILRIGETLPGGPDPGFWPWIQLLNPSGTLVASQYGALAAEVGVIAAATGTYTVRVASADSGNDALGDYVLRLAKVPGAFTVPGGDQGGALTNGANHAGRIEVGDLDMWTFTANQNDSAIVRIGEVLPSGADPGFWPWLRVYGPNGAYVEGQYGDRAAEVGFTVPLTGTYTVVVASADSGLDAVGDYNLRLARIPGTFTDENGGALVNGSDHIGRIDVGDLDTWTFTANQNDSALVRIGEVPVAPGTTDPGFWPWLRVYGPNGAFLGGQYGDRAAEVGFIAPLTGTYTVVVATADSGYDAAGDYNLRLARIPGTFTVPDGDQGGPLTNAGNHPGRIIVGDLDVWTFTATQNDSAIIRIGEQPVDSSTIDPGFWPWLRVYGPNGAYIGGQYGDKAAEVGFIAPLAGTYTVVVTTADSGYDAEGDYILRLARIPGTFSDENGGVMANGGNHPGRIVVGDLDTWTFTANQNESAILRIGEVPVDSGTVDPGFWPWIRVYGPSGTYIGGQYGDLAAEVGFVVPLTGTYTVVVTTADSGYDAEGDYVLRLSRMPGPFTVPSGDHGGAMTNGVNHPGRIEIGDLDMWSFAACVGATVTVTINEVPVSPDPGFWPWIRVYNPAGTYVGGDYGNTLAQLTHTVALSGTFTVVVSTANSGYDATGDYTVRVQTVGGVCGPPTTVADSYTTPINTTLSVAAPGVLGNDNTNAGGPMTAQLMSSVGTGTLVLNSDGSFTFTPPSGFTGAASFTYRAVNAFGAGNTVTVALTVYQGPTTVPDSYSTTFNTPLTVSAPGVLANDSANGGGAMTAELITTVATGTLGLNASGDFTFTPPNGFIGTTSFTYRAVTSGGAGNTATVTLTVNPLVPTTAGDSFSTNAGTTLNIAAPGVLANDSSNGGSALTAQLITTATNGILTLGADGSVNYSPNAGFSGTDSFTYQAVNNVGGGNAATVSIAVVATGPQPPTELYAAAVLGNLVKLRFKAPASGPRPTGYLLEGGVNPGQVLASIPTGSTHPIYVFNAPSGVFYVRMHTLVGSERSGPSNEIRIHVNAATDSPSAPADLTAVANGSSIGLAWRNTFAGGAPSGLVLDVSGSLTASLPLGLTDSFEFAGVPAGTYTLSLRAVNAVGSSPSSNAVTLTFPATICTGAPLPPASFLAYGIGNTINVTWEPAATGAAPTAFTLNVSGAFNGSITTPARTLSGQVGPGAYNLSVAAVNACGASAFTAPQTVVVP